MKDINDVMTYLNHILGPTHELSLTLKKHLDSHTGLDFSGDAEKVIIMDLVELIYTVKPLGKFVWEMREITAHLKEYFKSKDKIYELVKELNMSSEYGRHSDEFEKLCDRITYIVETDVIYLNKIVQYVETEVGGEVIKLISKK
jgi:hypothetical protein